MHEPSHSRVAKTLLATSNIGALSTTCWTERDGLVVAIKLGEDPHWISDGERMGKSGVIEEDWACFQVQFYPAVYTLLRYSISKLKQPAHG
jgi:hypothetical protein